MFAPILWDSLVQALVLICMPVVQCQWQLLPLTLVQNTGSMTIPEMFASMLCVVACCADSTTHAKWKTFAMHVPAHP